MRRNTTRFAVEESALLSEQDLERIRTGLRRGAFGPIAAVWIERLLEDREERVRRDRALAVQLLSTAGPAAGAEIRDHDAAGRRSVASLGPLSPLDEAPART